MKKVFTEEEKQRIAPYIDCMKSCGVSERYFYSSFQNCSDSKAKSKLLEIVASPASLRQGFFSPDRGLILEGNGVEAEFLLSLLIRTCAIGGIGVRLFYSIQDFKREWEDSEDGKMYEYSGLAFANFYDNEVQIPPLSPSEMYDIQMFIKTQYLLKCKPVFISGNGEFSKTNWWTSTLTKSMLANSLVLNV